MYSRCIYVAWVVRRDGPAGQLRFRRGAAPSRQLCQSGSASIQTATHSGQTMPKLPGIASYPTADAWAVPIGLRQTCWHMEKLVSHRFLIMEWLYRLGILSTSFTQLILLSTTHYWP